MGRVIPYLQDPQNVLDVTQVTFLHDKAPCMKALQTQNLLKDNNIDFFGNEEWPGNSPNLSACENAGSILKDEVEERMLSEPLATKHSRTKMEEHIDTVLREWSSTWSFLSHLCLPTLIVFKLFVTPMEGTLNTELVSIDPQ